MDDYDYDVAVTFAGEDRTFVEEVVAGIKLRGYTVFYDEDAKLDMWGEELTEYFPDIYEIRARFAVMFISVNYAAKPWTRLERRSVLLRAMQSATPYLLPVRLDSTVLPGLRSSISYLSASSEGAEGIAEAVSSKLGSPHSVLTSKFEGRVPRTPAEASIVLGERPTGWEYYYFSYLLAAGVEDRAERYLDHELGFASSGNYVEDSEIILYIRTEFSRLLKATESLHALLSGPAQEAAVGKPGEPGNPDLIMHLATRMMLLHDEILDWAYRIRAAVTPSKEGRETLRALGHYADQPIDAFRRLVALVRDETDMLTERLNRGETISLVLELEFEVPAGISAKYSTAFDALQSRFS